MRMGNQSKGGGGGGGGASAQESDNLCLLLSFAQHMGFAAEDVQVQEWVASSVAAPATPIALPRPTTNKAALDLATAARKRAQD